jgi:hypothetical protein
LLVAIGVLPRDRPYAKIGCNTGAIEASDYHFHAEEG